MVQSGLDKKIQEMAEQMTALKPFLRIYADSNLIRQKNGNYSCPICGDKDGFSIYEKGGVLQWKCHSAKHDEMRDHGDIVDLYKMQNNVSQSQAIKELSSMFLGGGITTTQSKVVPVESLQIVQEKKDTSKKAEKLRKILKPVCEVPWAVSYMYSRGISTDTLKKFEILEGYVDCEAIDGNWIQARAIYFYQKDVIGSCVRRQYSHLDEVRKPVKGNLGPKVLFNTEVLSIADRPIFVVEGETDVLSFAEIGLPAVGLSSTSIKHRLVEHLEKSGNRPKLVLMLDNDIEKPEDERAVNTTEPELLKMLLNAGVEAVRLNREKWGFVHSDPNDWLRADRASFERLRDFDLNEFEAVFERQSIQEVETTDSKAETIRETNNNGSEMLTSEDLDKVPHPADEVKEDSLSFPESIANKFESIREQLKTAPEGISTGFPTLDSLMKRGGLTNGLYLIGAPPSMGKSAFCLQMADSIAKNGHPVLFYSLEMLEDEMLMRSLTRLSATDESGEYDDTHAGSLDDIEQTFINGNEYEFEHAFKQYKAISSNVHFECFRHDAPILENMEKQITKFCDVYGSQFPVVFIDYLQLIKLRDPKLNYDNIARLSEISGRLKKLSNNCPIVVISSINRDSYKDEKAARKAGLDAFKGSGDIEYSANMAILLTKRLSNEDFPSFPDERRKEISLKAVKNRSKRSMVYFDLDFYGQHYFFKDVSNGEVKNID